ncbi:MAG: alanine racemase [Enterocloster sp.]
MFAGSGRHAQVVIEIEVGENRSGIIEEDKFMELLDSIKKAENVDFLGVFSHEGHCYNAESMEDCREKIYRKPEAYASFRKDGRGTGNEVPACQHRKHPKPSVSF